MRKQLIILLNIIIISLNGYSNNNPNEDVLYSVLCGSNIQADFTWVQDTNTILKMNFIDQSIGDIVSWNWNYGDNSYATGQYSTHTYAAPGFYIVCLTVMDSNACVDVFCDSIYVNYTMQCLTNFNYQPQGLSVLFDGSGTPTPFEYLWDFGDGNSNQAQSYIHTYQTAGTYNVCLSTKSIDPLINDTCISQNCKSITVISQAATLLGHVFVDTADGNYADKASVYLINVDSSNFFTVVDTALLVDSGSYTYFYFQNIPYGRYSLKAQLLPTSNNYLNYAPTYYGNKIYWNHAEIMNITTQSNSAFIDLTKVTSVNGIGSIGGKVVEGTAKVPGDPVSNIEILLLNMSYDPVAITYSDEYGKYNFISLPFNDYIVYAEVISKTTFPPTVSINATNPILLNVNLFINSTSVTTGLEGINSNYFEKNISQIFPNPSSDLISFDVETDLQEEVEINIYNNLGKVVYEQIEKLYPDNATYSINVSSFRQGVYFVNIRMGNNIFVVRKFVKLP